MENKRSQLRRPAETLDRDRSPRHPLCHALTRGNLRQVVEVLKVLKQISRHGNAGGVVLSK